MSYMVLSRQNEAYFPWCCSLHMHHDFLYSGSRNIKHYTCIQELILMFSAWVGRSGATGLSRSDTSVFTVTVHINRNLIAEKYSSRGLCVLFNHNACADNSWTQKMHKKTPKKQTQILDNVKLWPVVQSFPLTVSLLSPEGGDGNCSTWIEELLPPSGYIKNSNWNTNVRFSLEKK